MRGKGGEKYFIHLLKVLQLIKNHFVINLPISPSRVVTEYSSTLKIQEKRKLHLKQRCDESKLIFKMVSRTKKKRTRFFIHF